jgi:hypothetical protein
MTAELSSVRISLHIAEAFLIFLTLFVMPNTR